MEISLTSQVANHEGFSGGKRMAGKLITQPVLCGSVFCAVISIAIFSDNQTGSQFSQNGWFAIAAAIFALTAISHLLDGSIVTRTNTIKRAATSMVELNSSPRKQVVSEMSDAFTDNAADQKNEQQEF